MREIEQATAKRNPNRAPIRLSKYTRLPGFFMRVFVTKTGEVLFQDALCRSPLPLVFSLCGPYGSPAGQSLKPLPGLVLVTHVVHGKKSLPQSLSKSLHVVRALQIED